MANEIIGTRVPQPNGRVDVQMLYVFPIDPMVTDGSGEPVVPAFDLRGVPSVLASQLTKEQINEINAGTAGFHVTSFQQAAGEDDAEFATRALEDYAQVTAYVLQQRRDEAMESAYFNKRRFSIDAK